MSFYDFTKLYGTTQKAKFWCDYMTGLRGQLEARDTTRPLRPESVWSRVTMNEVLLYDVLYGEYFRAAGKTKVDSINHLTLLIILCYRERNRDNQLLSDQIGPRASQGTSALLYSPYKDLRQRCLHDAKDMNRENVYVNEIL